jgi:hypothetical protein
MDHKASQELANKQLDRVLGFFPRVETKVSFLFAMNFGLLAILVLNLQIADFYRWYLIIPAIAAVLFSAASLYFIYRCTFPALKGGANSLVYFREIAKRTETDFIVQVIAQDDEKYARDLLGQVWRNSEILKLKYDAMKLAFILIIIALVPWLLFLGEAALLHSPGLVLK